MTKASSTRNWSKLAANYPTSGKWPIFVAPDTFRGGRDREAEDETFRTQAGIRAVFGLDRGDWRIKEDTFCFDCGNTHDRTGELHVRSDVDDFEAIGQLDLAMWGQSNPTLVKTGRPSDSLLEIEWPGILNIGWTPPEALIVLRSWEERFGAVPLSVSDSTLALAVTRPPATIEEARQVAREHFHFCPYDTQFHGFDGIGRYVAKLVGAHVWNFWWD